MVSTRKERIGWYFYDWANSGFYTVVISVFFGPFITNIVKENADPSGFIYVLGIPIFNGSFFPYVISFSVILQTIFLPLLGAIADHSNFKKQFLLFFAYIGSLATCMMYFISGSNYLFGGLMFVVANFSFGSSAVMYNAFLGEIAEKKDQDTVSSIGWAIGYIGGGLLLAANLIFFSNVGFFNISKSDAVRISLMSAGMWWAFFTLIPAFTLKIRKRFSEDNDIIKSGLGLNSLKPGIKRLIITLKSARHYPATLIFLAAYLLYNDGVQSIITVSSTFGSVQLGVSIETLMQSILMVQFVAFFGSLIFNWIAKVLTTKKAIMLSLYIWIAAVVFAFGFAKDSTGFWIMAAIVAIVLGGTQALSRSMFASLIPVGSEAEYFSIYEISDKGTSWFGPMIFGLSLQLTQSYRVAIFSLIIFFLAGLILLFRLKKYNI